MAWPAISQVSPMMRQYLELKEQNKDCLLMFRLGDFYELFFDDAQTAARELQIVLTGRECGLPERAPMCGVPYHALDSYVDKLLAKGYKVAVCEQLQDPKTTKGLVDRGIVRIITPGTQTAGSQIQEKSNNFIMALYRGENTGLAVADVSTGAFSLGEIKDGPGHDQLFEELSRVQPTELIVSREVEEDRELLQKLRGSSYVGSYQDWAFEYQNARKNLLTHFKVADLSGFGCEEMRSGICAAGALLAYLNDTQKNTLSHISGIRVYRRSEYMVLDETTRRNLELTQPLRGGGKRGTLLGLLDRTQTAMGGRLLKSWIAQPLTSMAPLNLRLDAVGECQENLLLREGLREHLSNVYDLERLCGRIAYGSLNARDALSLKRSLQALPALKEDLACCSARLLCGAGEKLDVMADLCGLLDRAIALDPPAVITEGGIIRDGYNEKLDEYREASRSGKKWIEELEAREREETGIKNLRINFNRVFGYYIEVTKSNWSQVPLRYERKQTLANAERYFTPELKELEEHILGAEEKSVALEQQIFVGLRELLASHIGRIQKAAELLAQLDVLQSLGTVAAQYHYCRPTLHTGDEIDIAEGRHPVVERAHEGFVPNDTRMDCGANRFLIITGPNMAGKSTYMRQVALIVLMAHIGSFVPAKSALISMTDRIFTRVGALDDLSAGQSTFMVEMNETANILNNATGRSLLLLDEIGRGTSTFDGLSIAWAVTEHICNKNRIGAKTLFATHYHELSELEGLLDGVVNYRITAREMGEDIIFLRKVVRGGTDKSYGIAVARLAGIPPEVIRRAKEILRQLEAAEINRAVETPDQPKALAPAAHDALLREISSMKVDDVTPFEALGILYDLQQRAKKALGEQLI